MKKYDTYKESKVLGLDRIPAHWGAERIKYLFSERGELSTTGDEQLLSVSEYYGVAPRTSVMEEGEFVTRAESLVGYKKCFKGDLVSNIMLAWKGSMGVTEHDGIVSPAYSVYVPKEGINPQYFHYLFRTDLFKTLFKIRSRGIIESRLRLYTPDFFDITAIVPPVEEQDAIVEYLSVKEAYILSSIASLEAEKRHLSDILYSIIDETVKRGLCKNSSLKESGVKWIGKIPQKWFIAPLKRAFVICNGKDYKDIQSETGYPVYGSGGQFAYATQYIYDGEALLLGRKGTIDKPIYINGPFWTVDTMFYAIPNDSVCCKYMYYQAKTIPFGYYSTNTALPSMTQSDLGVNPMCIPPIEEQQAIAGFLDKKSAEINEAIATIDAQIKALQDYRKSLIFEAVTGKIDVR